MPVWVGYFIAFLLSLISILLGLLCYWFHDIRMSLKSKMDRDECGKIQGQCHQGVRDKLVEMDHEIGDIWNVINGHSHEGLPAISRVVRGKG